MGFSKRQVEIIEAATKLIGEKGIQNLTTKNLALEMGFSEPALYRHFDDKTMIMESVLLYYKERLKNGLNNISQVNATGLEKIKDLIEFQFSHFAMYPAVIMVIFAETSFQNDNRLSKVVLDIMTQKSDMVAGIISAGQKEGNIRNDINAEHLATTIMGILRFTVLKWRLSNFEFDLIEEGKSVWNTAHKLISSK